MARSLLVFAPVVGVASLLAWLSSADDPIPSPHGEVSSEIPSTLRATGLYEDWASKRIAADVLPYAPQYPLYTDGAEKARWIRLPPGAAVDASLPEDWKFPVGTRLWKEFAFDRRIETRFMERRENGWLFATYVWSEDGSEARLAEPGRRAARVFVGTGAPHEIPTERKCRSCHGGAQAVLGFSALQLSSDRDPGAIHGGQPPIGFVDLRTLETRGLLRGLPEVFRASPPRIEARSDEERAILGYLHANCGGCHDGRGALASNGMVLAYPLQTEEQGLPPAISTTVDRESHFLPPGTAGEHARRIVPGRPEQSVLLTRLRSRDPSLQMPPLGTHRIDVEAVERIEEWIRRLPELSASRTDERPHDPEGDPS